jgi:predicted transcriptional regulator
MKEVLLRKADEFSGATRNYFEQLKKLLQQQRQSTFTNREIRKQLRLPGTTVRRYHNELLQSGYIKLQESKKQNGYLFEIVSYEEYIQLQNHVASVLDNIITILNKSGASEPPVSQKINGSIKRRTVKILAEVSQ